MVIDALFSSDQRPLVSGTSFAVNGMVRKHMVEDMKNVPTKKRKKVKVHVMVLKFTYSQLVYHR